MTPDSIAPMIVLVTAVLTCGGVLIFRPISKRLGTLLEVTIQQKLKSANADPMEAARIREVLANIDSRLSLLEERQDFAEALMSSGGDPKLLSTYAAQAAQERN